MPKASLLESSNLKSVWSYTTHVSFRVPAKVHRGGHLSQETPNQLEQEIPLVLEIGSRSNGGIHSSEKSKFQAWLELDETPDIVASF